MECHQRWSGLRHCFTDGDTTGQKGGVRDPDSPVLSEEGGTGSSLSFPPLHTAFPWLPGPGINSRGGHSATLETVISSCTCCFSYTGYHSIPQRPWEVGKAGIVSEEMTSESLGWFLLFPQQTWDRIPGALYIKPWCLEELYIFIALDSQPQICVSWRQNRMFPPSLLS